MAQSSSRPIRDVLAFAAVTLGAIVGLAALNRLPAAIGGEPLGVLRYDSVAQVSDRYQVTPWQPRTLPAPWSWPPTRIRVKPGELDWVEYEFGDGAGGGLVACQTLARVDRQVEVPTDLLPPGELLQADEAVVAGRPARVGRLLLADGTIVHELWWRWNGRTIMLRLRGTPAALHSIAERAMGSAE
ncbi:MAG: hypothetical protein ACM3NQ_02810 [Bacteroidales bacterium]